MSPDTALRVLLGLILACLVVLVIQGFGNGDGGGPRYQVSALPGKDPWIVRIDTRTGQVERLKLRGDRSWATLGAPPAAAPVPAVETGSVTPPAAAPAPEPVPGPEPEPASVAAQEPAAEAAARAPKKPKKKMAPDLKPIGPPPLPKPRPVQVNPKSQVEALSHALSPENPVSIRVWAAEQLGAQGGEDSIPVLIRTLSDSDTAVVVAAIRALRDSGDPGTRPAIEPLLQHPSADVQKAAREALESP